MTAGASTAGTFVVVSPPRVFKKAANSAAVSAPVFAIAAEKSAGL